MTILVSVKKLRRALQMRVEKTKLVVEPSAGRNSRLARLVYHPPIQQNRQTNRSGGGGSIPTTAGRVTSAWSSIEAT
jgi:hypothetical protein